jgi:TonB family protein
MIKNKLLIALTFALIPSSVIWLATTRNAIAETPNSSKLTQCLINIRNSRASQPIAKSPEQQRIQGRVEIAIDTDEQGNVTNARLVRSSGNAKLDEMTLIQARNWKLKPATGTIRARNNVKVSTTYIKRQNAC